MKRMKTQTYLIVSLSLIFSAILLSFLFLELRYHESVRSDTLGEIHYQISQRVNDNLRAYLLETEQAFSAVEALAMQKPLNSREDLQNLLPMFWAQLTALQNTGAFFISLNDDEFLGYAKVGGPPELMEAGAFSNYDIVFSSVDARGEPTEETRRKPGFHATKRSWYWAASQADQATWSEVFQYHAYPVNVIPYSKALRDPNGDIIAVLGANLFLEAFETTLARMSDVLQVKVHVLDAEGNVVTGTPGNTVKRAFDTLNVLHREGSVGAKYDQSDLAQFEFDGRTFSMSVSAFQSSPGLDWQIVTLADPEVLLSRAHEDTLFLYLYTLALYVLGILFIVSLVRRFVQPISELSEYVNHVAANPEAITAENLKDIEAPSQEIQTLVDSFNRVAHALHERMTSKDIDIYQKEHLITELQRFERIASTTDNMVVITDAKQRIVWVNEGFERVSGYRLDEVLGKTPGSFLAGHGTDPAAQRKLNEGIQNGQAVQVVLLNYSKHGEPYWSEISVQPVRNHRGEIIEYFSIQRDITAQVRYEQDLRLWKNIFDIANWGIGISEGESNAIISDVNVKFSQMLGYSVEECRGMPVSRLYSKMDDARIRAIAEKVEQEGSATFEATMIRKSGESFPAFINLSKIEGATGKPMRLANVQDISAIRSLETQLQQAQKLESIGLMASNLVHDFNNVLANIVVNSELGLLGAQDAEKADMENIRSLFDSTLGSAQYAGKMVEGFLQFTRSGDTARRAIALDQLVRRVSEMIPSKHKDQANLSLDIQATNAVAMVNETQVEQVLINLLTNAFDAALYSTTDRPEVSITLAQLDDLPSAVRDTQVEKEGDVKVSEKSASKWIEISVRDNGPGVPEALREKIFEPLFTTKAKGLGTGLGLSIVRRLMKKQDGYVSLSSERGDTQFKLYFRQVDESKQQQKATSNLARIRPEQETRIALVDDQKTLTMRLSSLLRGHGYAAVQEFNQAKDALAFLTQTDSLCDVLITDLSMPEMSGFELVEAVQGLESAPQIIVLSGHITQDEREYLQSLGVANVLAKPVTIGELVETIEGVVSSR